VNSGLSQTQSESTCQLVRMSRGMSAVTSRHHVSHKLRDYYPGGSVELDKPFRTPCFTSILLFVFEMSKVVFGRCNCSCIAFIN